MSLHTPTILLLIVAVSAVLSAALAFVADRRRTALVPWVVALAMAAHAVGYALFSLRGQISDFASIVLGNMALATTFALLCEALYGFQQRPPPRTLIWLLVALTGVNCSLLIDAAVPRAAINGVFFALQAGTVLRSMWQGRGQTVGRGQYLLIAAVLTLLVVALRAPLLVATGSAEVALLSSSQPGNALGFLAVLVSLLLAALGMLSMTQERAEAALRAGQVYERFRSSVLDLLATGVALPALLTAFVNGVERLLPGSGCSVNVLGAQGPHFTADAAPVLGMRCSLALLASDRQLLGTMTLHRHAGRAPAAADIAFAEGLAQLAALAIERSADAQRLRDSESLHRQLIEAANEGIFVVQDDTLRYVNPRLRQMLGGGHEELVGSPFMNLVHPADRMLVARKQQAPQRGEDDRLHYHVRLLTKAQGARWFELSPVQFEWRGQAAVLNFVTDITERKLMDEQFHELAYHDMLTGLPNRRMLLDHLQLVLAANRRSGRHGALLFLDLDNFKPLNDQYGHKVGDLLLVEVGRRLRDCVRDMDTVARFGGDEFVVLLNDLSEDPSLAQAQAARLAEKARQALAEPYVLMVQRESQASTVAYRCSASVGVRLFSAADREGAEETLLNQADAAMYEAKEGGCNTVRFHPGDTV